MAKTKEQIFEQLRIGLVFQTFLDENKEHAKRLKTKEEKNRVIDSFNKLDSETRLRKATLINIFRGKSDASASSMIAILSALNRTFTEFGEKYDSLSDEDVVAYRQTIK